jgi:hypothetical protein
LAPTSTQPFLRQYGGPTILIVGLATLAIGLAVNASELFDLIAPPAVSYPVVIPVLNNPVTAGSTLVLEVTRCAWAITGPGPVSAEVTRELARVDPGSRQIVVLPSVRVDVPVGCVTIESRLSIIPVDLPPGRWILRGAATARNKTTTYQTAVFDVTAP